MCVDGVGMSFSSILHMQSTVYGLDASALKGLVWVDKRSMSFLSTRITHKIFLLECILHPIVPCSLVVHCLLSLSTAGNPICLWRTNIPVSKVLRYNMSTGSSTDVIFFLSEHHVAQPMHLLHQANNH